MNSYEEPTSPAPDDDIGSKVPYILTLFVLVAAAYGGYKWWQVEEARAEQSLAIYDAQTGPPLTEFELTERSGEPFRSEEMRGRVWVATYFFTTCPGSCIRLNENIKLMHDLEDLQEVTWVSITCDPDTDTVEVLRDYADRRGADPERWLFCRADLDYVKRVADGMKLDVGLKGHQDRAIVIDKQGKVRGFFNATSKQECQQMRKLLLELQDEPAPADATASAKPVSDAIHIITSTLGQYFCNQAGGLAAISRW